ncbi:MAG: peptidoglycan synthetase [Bacteroidales bacterium]|nr:peptidoglycan synthetase [Bacteroidales bacterium]
MKVHLIACGGAVMHNMAIALHKKGYEVTGSDDEIFEPAKSRLKQYGLLPEKIGWDSERIKADIDIIILGMHARENNPELIKAKELNLKIVSFPEYLYEQTKNKTRIVIGGSHGKTSVSSMIMHVMKNCGYNFDYMVGAKIEGFDTMVNLEEKNEIAVFEGDEYLSSAIDPSPKFHWYKPHIAALTGIAWDHINVFPTFENYVKQFDIFIDKIENEGSLIYYSEDEILKDLTKNKTNIEIIPYKEIENKPTDNQTIITANKTKYIINLIGKHNMQNINAAKLVCNKIGISDDDFFKEIASFKGAAKRLQLIAQTDNSVFYLDFAHAPSKLKATTQAVKMQYPNRKLVACIELHTFSSLSKNFLPQYKNTMEMADTAIVYYNKQVIAHKNLENIEPQTVEKEFGGNVMVFTNSKDLQNYLKSLNWENKNLLMMSSGNFDGINFDEFAIELRLK